MPDFWTRIRKARLFQVLVTYLVVAWVVLQVADLLTDTLALPRWVAVATLLVLLAGLPIVMLTAWLTAHPPEDPSADGVITQRERVVHRWVLPNFTWKRAILGGVATLAVLGLVGVLARGRVPGFGEARADVAGIGLAVLPFHATGPDSVLWGEGMVDLLTTNLDGVAGLRTIDPATVLARIAGARSLEERLQVARDVRARYALIGSAVVAGSTARLDAEVHDLETGAEVAHARVEGSPDSVLVLVDRLSIELVRELMDATGQQRASGLRNAESVTTSSIEALRAYLEGERLYRVGDLPAAAAAYERAIRADSTFALAYWGLSWSYGWTSDSAASAQSDSTFARLVALSERLPERTRVFVRGDSLRRAGDFGAIDVFESAVRRYPDDPEAWYMLGEVRFHAGDEVAGLRAQIDPFLRAIALDPSAGTYYYHPIPSLISYQDTTAADSLIEQFLAHTGDTVRAEAWRLTRRVLTPPIAEDPAAILRELEGASELELAEAVKASWWATPWPAATEVIADAALAGGVAPGNVGGAPIVARIEQGKLRELAAMIRAGRLPPNVGPIFTWLARRLGFDVPQPMVDRFYDPGFMNGSMIFWSGLDGFQSGDRTRLAAAATSIDRALAADQLPADMRPELGFQRDALRALGHGLAANDPSTAADTLAAVLDNARSITSLSSELSISMLRNVLIDLYIEADRAAEALPLIEPYVGLRPSPLLAHALGRAHEKLGNEEEAARFYAIFLDAWKNADAEVRILTDTRRALDRLTAE